MTKKPKTKRIIRGPKYRGFIPHSEILKAIRKVAAARRAREQVSVGRNHV